MLWPPTPALERGADEQGPRCSGGRAEGGCHHPLVRQRDARRGRVVEAEPDKPREAGALEQPRDVCRQVGRLRRHASVLTGGGLAAEKITSSAAGLAPLAAAPAPDESLAVAASRARALAPLLAPVSTMCSVTPVSDASPLFCIDGANTRQNRRGDSDTIVVRYRSGSACDARCQWLRRTHRRGGGSRRGGGEEEVDAGLRPLDAPVEAPADKDDVEATPPALAAKSYRRWLEVLVSCGRRRGAALHAQRVGGALPEIGCSRQLAMGEHSGSGGCRSGEACERDYVTRLASAGNACHSVPQHADALSLTYMG